MTLIVALQGRDGLLIGADSRGTIGDPRGLTAINDNHQKIFELSKFCGIGVSGASELATKLIDELAPKLSKEKIIYADDVVDESRKLIKTRFHEWFELFPVDKRPIISLTIAGFATGINGDLIPRLYLLMSPLDFAPHLFQSGYVLSGIPQYAVYLLHRLYDKQMTLSNLAALAVYLISETATQDPKVGGPIKLAQITTDNGYVELNQEDIKSIMEKNEEQSRKLKQFFFEG